MFTKLFSPFINPDQKISGELDIKLCTLNLEMVSDCFDAHSLWDHKYASDREVMEKETRNRKMRLKSALDNHRRVLNTTMDGKWLQKEGKVFTDVVLQIPQEKWQDDMEVGANRLVMLIDNLKRRHSEDFSKDLYQGKMPRYVVMPDPDLGSNEVSFKFGMGVYVPALEENPVATIEIKMEHQDEWLKLPEWLLFNEGQLVKKPVGIYKEQQGLLIGSEKEFSSIRLNQDKDKPLWFSHGRGSLFINYALKAINFAFGDGKIISKAGNIESKDIDKGEVIFRYKDLTHVAEDPGDTGETLLLKITDALLQKINDDDKQVVTSPKDNEPQENEPEMADEPTGEASDPDGQDQNDSVPPEEFPGETLGQDKKTMVMSRKKTSFKTLTLNQRTKTADPVQDGLKNAPHMFLEGYALPRIDIFNFPGLKSWVLWLDDMGVPLDPAIRIQELKKEDKMGLLAVSAHSDQNALYVKKPGEPEFIKIDALPWTMDGDENQSTEIGSLPENDYYHGILQIPRPDRFFSLEKTPLVLGRDGRDESDDVRMDLLNNPDFLKWEKGKEIQDAYMGLINLSRKHARLILNDSELEVTNISEDSLSGGSPLFIVRNNGQLDILESDSSQSAVLAPGERILTGCCMLRFEMGGNDTENENNIKKEENEPRKFDNNPVLEICTNHSFTRDLAKLSGNRELSGEDRKLLERAYRIKDRYQTMDDLSGISIEGFVTDMDILEEVMALAGTDREMVKKIKTIKIDFIRRIEKEQM